MDLNKDWQKIREHFNKSFSTSLHVSIASLDETHHPTLTPIGSLFLNNDQTGFYFEKFPSKLPKYAGINKHVCLLGVNSSRWFWIKSLIKGRFTTNPAIRLYGELGTLRKATDVELSRLKRRMRFTHRLKGHKYLWGKMDQVREISFYHVEPINLGKMTKD